MFDLGHVALLLLAGVIGGWIWRGMGLRDHALGLVRRRCNDTDVQLLDESIALVKLRLAWHKGRPWVLRRYGFEFTVTGERRYSGYIELLGPRLRHIELAPHPFPGPTLHERLH